MHLQLREEMPRIFGCVEDERGESTIDCIPRLIKVTFKEHFPIELIDSMVESEFLGLGTAYRRDDLRVLYVQPDSERYLVLKEQLDVWEREGACSFVEELK